MRTIPPKNNEHHPKKRRFSTEFSPIFRQLCTHLEVCSLTQRREIHMGTHQPKVMLKTLDIKRQREHFVSLFSCCQPPQKNAMFFVKVQVHETGKQAKKNPCIFMYEFLYKWGRYTQYSLCISQTFKSKWLSESFDLCYWLTIQSPLYIKKYAHFSIVKVLRGVWGYSLYFQEIRLNLRWRKGISWHIDLGFFLTAFFLLFCRDLDWGLRTSFYVCLLLFLLFCVLCLTPHPHSEFYLVWWRQRGKKTMTSTVLYPNNTWWDEILKDTENFVFYHQIRSFYNRIKFIIPFPQSSVEYEWIPKLDKTRGDQKLTRFLFYFLYFGEKL